MSKRIYLHKPSGRGHEFLGCAGIVCLLAAVAVVVILMFGGIAGMSSLWMRLSGGDGRGHLAGQPKAFFRGDAPAEMNALFGMVRDSPHVVGNKMYSTIARNIRFVYDANDNSINAAASMRPTGQKLQNRGRDALVASDGRVDCLTQRRGERGAGV